MTGGAPIAADDIADMRQAIEALRLGVVPAKHVLDYTVGRDKELASFRDLLGGRQGLRLVFGDYGRGKTHLLELYEQLAQEQGFVTARVVLNPKATPPSHPQRLYRAVLSRLSYPGETTLGLDPLLRRLEHSDAHALPGRDRYSRFFSPVLFARRSGDDELRDWMQDYIEGFNIDPDDVSRELAKKGWRGQRMLALSDFRTYGRMYTHMLGTLADWAADAGFKGLVLLLDEVERVDVLTKEQQELAREVLAHFAAATLPDGVLCFQPEQLYKGGHSVHRSFAIKYAATQPLSVVMALTPLDGILQICDTIVTDRGLRQDLAGFGPSEHATLVEKLTALYENAHPGFVSSPDVRERIRAFVDGQARRGVDAARHVVAAVVCLLDVARLVPERFERALA